MTRWQQKQHQLQHQQFPANSHTKPSHIADVALTTDCGRREGTVIQHEVRKSNKKQVKKQQIQIFLQYFRRQSGISNSLT